MRNTWPNDSAIKCTESRRTSLSSVGRLIHGHRRVQQPSGRRQTGRGRRCCRSRPGRRPRASTPARGRCPAPRSESGPGRRSWSLRVPPRRRPGRRAASRRCPAPISGPPAVPFTTCPSMAPSPWACTAPARAKMQHQSETRPGQCPVSRLHQLASGRPPSASIVAALGAELVALADGRAARRTRRCRRSFGRWRADPPPQRTQKRSPGW